MRYHGFAEASLYALTSRRPRGALVQQGRLRRTLEWRRLICYPLVRLERSPRVSCGRSASPGHARTWIPAVSPNWQIAKFCSCVDACFNLSSSFLSSITTFHLPLTSILRSGCILRYPKVKSRRWLCLLLHVVCAPAPFF